MEIRNFYNYSKLGGTIKSHITPDCPDTKRKNTKAGLTEDELEVEEEVVEAMVSVGVANYVVVVLTMIPVHTLLGKYNPTRARKLGPKSNGVEFAHNGGYTMLQSTTGINDLNTSQILLGEWQEKRMQQPKIQV